jgi:hypothetical protein
MTASNSSIVSTFVASTSLFLQPPNQNCNKLSLDIQTALSRQPFRSRHFFLSNTDITTYQNIEFTS